MGEVILIGWIRIRWKDKKKKIAKKEHGSPDKLDVTWVAYEGVEKVRHLFGEVSKLN